MNVLCNIYEVTNRRHLLSGADEDYTWHLFRNKQGTIAGGTFHRSYAKAVFIRVPRYSNLDEIAPLVHKAIGREEPYAVCELGTDASIVNIQPLLHQNNIPYCASFNLYEQPQDEAKRRTVAPLMVK